jgi:transcriptional regulator with XRE-family HTH domain
LNPRGKHSAKDPELVELGQRIRAIREASGETQESVADAAGLHWSYVGQIERGERNLTYKNVLRLAQGLGVQAAELMPSK